MPSAVQTTTVVVSWVRSGPSHCVLVLGCAAAATGAAAGALCPADLALGVFAAPGAQISDMQVNPNNLLTHQSPGIPAHT